MAFHISGSAKASPQGSAPPNCLLSKLRQMWCLYECVYVNVCECFWWRQGDQGGWVEVCVCVCVQHCTMHRVVVCVFKLVCACKSLLWQDEYVFMLYLVTPLPLTRTQFLRRWSLLEVLKLGAPSLQFLGDFWTPAVGMMSRLPSEGWSALCKEFFSQ